ncbi:hypothetical protein F5Y05DRAFT_309961 [Hypoxylon sp. FL0543]|nr:hypothetical protein F5Y05DRAFT_309961 [Hypoxylon sp. FL0543]
MRKNRAKGLACLTLVTTKPWGRALLCGVPSCWMGDAGGIWHFSISRAWLTSTTSCFADGVRNANLMEKSRPRGPTRHFLLVEPTSRKLLTSYIVLRYIIDRSRETSRRSTQTSKTSSQTSKTSTQPSKSSMRTSKPSTQRSKTSTQRSRPSAQKPKPSAQKSKSSKEAYETSEPPNEALPIT